MAEGGNCKKRDFSDIAKKLQQLSLNEQEKIYLEATLLKTKNDVASICQHIEGLSQAIIDEIHYLAEADATVTFALNRAEQRLAEVRRKNSERAAYHAACLAAQEKEYQAKVAQSETIRKEIDHYGNVLKQKKAAAAGHHEQLKTESGEMAKRNRVLKRLRLKLAARTSKFSEDQNNLKASSSELDKEINDSLKEIEELQESIAKKNKQLEAVKADNVTKKAQLMASRSRTEAIKENAERQKLESHKIMTEFEANAKKREDEIARLEGRLAEERAKYEDVNKVYTDLTDRINVELGSSKLLEKMTIEAQTEFKTLDMKRSKLSETIDTIRQSMRSNEIKLAELNDEKEEFFRQLDMKVETMEKLTQNQSSQSRRKRSERRISTETESSEMELPIFLMPHGVPKKSNRSQKRKKQLVQKRQAEEMASSAGSSMTDSTMPSVVEESRKEADLNNPSNDRKQLELFKKHFM